MNRSSSTGLVCPRCEHRSYECIEPFAVCPNDHYALIAAGVLATADGDPLLGMTVSGRYVVLGKIGRGSTGVVYRAFDTKAQRWIALKVLRGDSPRDTHRRERIECEARALEMLRSPYVVKLLDQGQFVFENADELSDPVPAFFLAMEMLEGEPLSKRLMRLGKLSLRDSIRFASHLLLALSEVHDCGLVHRDLTPNNLFLAKSDSNEEMGKLVDFGLAVFVREVFPGSEAFAAIGTPRYMSPEQVRGEVLDGRSDLYSVGLLLYQMVTGFPPFGDADAARVMTRHEHEVPRSLGVMAPNAGVSQGFSDIVERALAKDPQDRPQSAREFLTMLGDVSSG